MMPPRVSLENVLRASLGDRGVRLAALEALQDIGAPMRPTPDDAIAAVQSWTMRNVRFVPEGSEVFETPAEVLQVRGADCDGHAALVASMLHALGLSVRLQYQALPGAAPHHVLAEAWNGREWVPVETTPQPVADDGDCGCGCAGAGACGPRSAQLGALIPLSQEDYAEARGDNLPADNGGGYPYPTTAQPTQPTWRAEMINPGLRPRSSNDRSGCYYSKRDKRWYRMRLLPDGTERREPCESYKVETVLDRVTLRPRTPPPQETPPATRRRSNPFPWWIVIAAGGMIYAGTQERR